MLTRNWLKVTLTALLIAMLAGFVSADTVSVPINKSNYTKINTTLGPITIEARSDRVYLAFSDTKPALWSQAAHMLEADETIRFGAPPSDVWALATAPNQNVVVTEELDLIERSATGSVGLATFKQDQTTPMISVKANQVVATTVLNGATSLYDDTIVVDDATGFVIGHSVVLTSNISDRFYVGSIINIVSNTITLDNPLDYAFEDGQAVSDVITDMGVDGSTTRQVFSLRAAEPPGNIDLTVDITRIIITCTDTTAVDLLTFCGGPALTRGLLIRRVDGTAQNLFNWKTNKDIVGSMYDWEPYSASNPQQGVDGFGARLTFTKLGVVARVGPGEDVEAVVQDDQTGFDIEVTFQGHVVQ